MGSPLCIHRRTTAPHSAIASPRDKQLGGCLGCVVGAETSGAEARGGRLDPWAYSAVSPSRYRTQSVGLTVRTGLASALCVPLGIGGWSDQEAMSCAIQIASHGVRKSRPWPGMVGRGSAAGAEKNKERGEASTIGHEAADDLTGTAWQPRLADGAESRRKARRGLGGRPCCGFAKIGTRQRARFPHGGAGRPISRPPESWLAPR